LVRKHLIEIENIQENSNYEIEKMVEEKFEILDELVEKTSKKIFLNSVLIKMLLVFNLVFLIVNILKIWEVI
jgi:hypothetical protein